MGARASNGARRFECIDRACHWQGYRSLGKPTPCPRCRGPVHDVSLRRLGDAVRLPLERRRQVLTCSVLPLTMKEIRLVKGRMTLAMFSAQILDAWAIEHEAVRKKGKS